MIETVVGERPGGGLSAADLAGWVEQLAVMDVRAGDVERIDRIRELERVKSACAAAQAVLTVAFVQSQTAGLSTKRARDERTRRSVSGQVAVARRESPFRGGRHVGLARVLTSEMPNVFAALRSGVISEWGATLVVRETACLSLEDRRQVDAELVGQLGGLSEKQVALAAARIGQRLDPGLYVARARKAVGDRRVSCRPAPDLMTYVTALVPVAWGVAVYAALVKHAAAAKAVGDPRSRGQLMADEFVHRITAPAAGTGTGAGAGVEAQVGSGSWISTGAARSGTGSRASTGTRSGTGTNAGTGPGGGAGADGESRAATHTPARDGSPADACPPVGSEVASDVAADTGPAGGDRAADSMPEPGAAPGSVVGSARGGAPSCGATGRDKTATTEIADAVSWSAADSSAVRPQDPNSDRTDRSDAGRTQVSGPASGRPENPDPDPDLDADGLACGVGVIPPGVGLDIQLVMSDRTLFDGDNEPAILTGYGPIPAALARRLVREASPAIKSWVRRLYTDPGTGQLIDADSRRRLFSPAARQYLIARDQTCRGPFCDAPIRHADHVVPHEQGGPTRTVNGQGLCERCNHTKEQPGWQSVVDESGITITTPTGHTVRSVPPPPPRSTPWAEDRPIEYWPIKNRPVGHLAAESPLERRLLSLIRTVA